jgi:ornithine decarboxylase
MAVQELPAPEVANMKKRNLEKVAVENGIMKPDGRSVFIIDHDRLRDNFRKFSASLPRVQPYYAVKANPDREILNTLFQMGSSFDVASISEFMLVYKMIEKYPKEERRDFVWDKIIYANTIKPEGTLRKLNMYKPLVTFDNIEELKKIRRYGPQSGLILRVEVPNTGSMVELSSKFGASPSEAVDLIKAALEFGLGVEGISFHVGSQCANFQNYLTALKLSSDIFNEAESRGYVIGAAKHGQKRKQLDIGGGFPVKYDRKAKSFDELSRLLNGEFDRLFPKEVDILAEPGRFMVATACTLVAKVIGKAVRKGKPCYYLNDGAYHTFSGTLFDHCPYPLKSFKGGVKETCATFGPTCDALDRISDMDRLPNLEIGDLVYAENIGAYSVASTTTFNGFPSAKVVHINR